MVVHVLHSQWEMSKLRMKISVSSGRYSWCVSDHKQYRLMLYTCSNTADRFSARQPCFIKQPDPHSTVLGGLSEQTEH